jgi:A/G-specific adenine glycosylase
MARKPRAAASPCDRAASEAADRRLTADLAAWFDRAARDLPWRKARRDPWTSLVSEVMLQQTQVSRVLERFGPFMAAFPTPAAMADAGEAAVLALWSGMGYYRRARLLFAAAREIVVRFGGRVPSDVKDLRSLPGVGRYTAGAVASLVFGACEPIVDGNVARVLLRVHGRDLPAAEGVAWCWDRAGELARAAGDRTAAFNEGLMELGATVCTPKSPRCGACPLAGFCAARAAGLVDRIPRPKDRPARARVLSEVVVVRDGRGRVLVERREDTGMWAGLWQAPTRETPGEGGGSPLFMPTAEGLLEALGLAGVELKGVPEEFTHATTHREVVFRVWRGAWVGEGAVRGKDRGGGERRWVTAEEWAGLARSNPQRRALDPVFDPPAEPRGRGTRRTRGRPSP